MAWLEENIRVLAISLAVSLVLFGIGRIIYRLTLHPLAKVPGSRLSHASYIREMYYALWKNGKYNIQLIKDHEKYGTVDLPSSSIFRSSAYLLSQAQSSASTPTKSTSPTRSFTTASTTSAANSLAPTGSTKVSTNAP